MQAEPQFIYGTAWKEERTEALVKQALDAGFRAFDTANQRKHYHEVGLGRGLVGGPPRETLFLQSKFTFQRGQDHRLPYDPAAPIGEQVAQSFASSLEHLGTSYLDSLVLHGPTLGEGLVEADWQAWQAMEALVDAGTVRFLGISNTSAGQLAELLERARIPPRYVQNRCYASMGWDREVRAIASANILIYQGFSLLTANRAVWNHTEVASIARARGITPAQVLFCWARSLGILPLTGSSDPRHLAQDLGSLDIELDPGELRRLEVLG